MAAPLEEATTLAPLERTRRPERIVEWATVAFGSWTLYCHAVVFSGGSFRSLVRFSWAPILMGVLVAIALSRASKTRPTQPAAPFANKEGRTNSWARLLCAVGVVIAYAYSGNYLVLWMGGTLLAFVLLLDGPPAGSSSATDHGPPEADRGALGSLFLLALVAVVITLVTHRSDLDDSLYLNMAVGALDHPELPLLSQDTIFGYDGLPLLNPIYRTSTYELLVAVCSYLTSADVKWLYYLAFPALTAALIVPTTYAAMRELGSPRPALGVAFVVVLMVTWGDVHWTHANFGFVRLFQGKAVLVSVGIPAIVYFAARFVHRPGLVSWGFLLAAQVAALGLSANGLFAAPTAAGLVLAGRLGPTKSEVGRVLLGLLASSYVILLGIVVAFDLAVITTAQPEPIRTLGTATNLHAVLGYGLHADVILVAILSLAAIPTDPVRARTLAGWGLAIIFVLLSPMTSDAVAFVQALNWRIFWAAPFPLVVGLAMSALSSFGPSWHRVRVGALLAGVLVASFVFDDEPWTTSLENDSIIASPTYKVDPFHDFAGLLVATTPPNGVVLAPWDVAGWLPTFRNHPRAIETRDFHLRLIERAEGLEEASRRRHLQRLMELGTDEEMSIPRRPGRRFQSFRKDLDHFGVTTVLVDNALPWQRPLVRHLRAAGFRGRNLGIYQLWVRPEPPPPPAAHPDVG